MASLVYEISTHIYDKTKYLKPPEKDENGNPAEPVDITKRSERQYKNHAIKFGLWCKGKYKCRHFDDCKSHIQDYADYLTKEGYSASTIHTYLAAVCRVWGVDMAQFKSPNGISLKIPEAVAKKLWTSERTHNERLLRGCTTLLPKWDSAAGSTRSSAVVIW